MRNISQIRLFRSLVVHKLGVRMSSKVSYEDAVHKLNKLQSNKSTIEQIRRDIKTHRKCTNIEDMENYLLRTGVTLSKLDELSVIHVAGTKGKGSTSAMCESILRRHGYRTGFYSSPHLVAVRERIRLDGRVLEQQQFAEHFHQVYDMLDATKACDGDMPKYFAFLTVMAFNVFLKEKVDVAIVEVGIGGVVDYTNVLRKVPVVGITALGLDHTSILGNTIEQIAAAKAGVMKPGCVAFTMDQPPAAMHVLKRVAEEAQCPLTIVPDFKSYKYEKDKLRLPVNLEAYQNNSSLAIQLAHAWMKLSKHTHTRVKTMINTKVIRPNGITEIDPHYVNGIDKKTLDVVVDLPSETAEGVTESKWPGRYQVLCREYAKFYMDGAHTKESMEICAKWFRNNSRTRTKMLIFSATGDRDAEILLKPLRNLNFQTVFFVIPTAYKETNQASDNYSIMENTDLILRCQSYAKIWEQINSSQTKMTVLECVSDAIEAIKEYNETDTSVLITGSLHLVGAALSILDPNLSGD